RARPAIRSSGPWRSATRPFHLVVQGAIHRAARRRLADSGPLAAAQAVPPATAGTSGCRLVPRLSPRAGSLWCLDDRQRTVGRHADDVDLEAVEDRAVSLAATELGLAG